MLNINFLKFLNHTKNTSKSVKTDNLSAYFNQF